MKRRSWVGRWQAGDVEDLLYVGLVLSLVAEVSSILADQAVLAALFLVITLLPCGAAWKWRGS